MDSQGPERNSNSPNGSHSEDDTGLQVIESIQRGESAGTVVLADGSSFLIHPKFAFELQAGEAISVRDLLFRNELHQVKQKAVELLAPKEHSAFQLRIKLQRRGFSLHAVDTVIRQLCAGGTINDRRFAEMWLASRLRTRPEGLGALKAGLAAKGVDRSIIEQTLKKHVTEDAVHDALLRAYEKIEKRAKGDTRKSFRALLNRGFTRQQILKVLKL